MNTHVHNMADVKVEKGKGKKQRQQLVVPGSTPFLCHQSGNSVPKRPEEQFLTATTSCFSMFRHNMVKSSAPIYRSGTRYRFFCDHQPTVVQEIHENCEILNRAS